MVQHKRKYTRIHSHVKRYDSHTIHVCMYVCIYVCMYVWVYVCMYVRMHVCMYPLLGLEHDSYTYVSCEHDSRFQVSFIGRLMYIYLVYWVSMYRLLGTPVLFIWCVCMIVSWGCMHHLLGMGVWMVYWAFLGLFKDAYHNTTSNRFRLRLRLRTDIFKTTKSDPGSMGNCQTRRTSIFWLLVLSTKIYPVCVQMFACTSKETDLKWNGP